MKSILAAVCLSLLVIGCGSAPATLPIKDRVQIRPVLAGDPLAAKVPDLQGETVGVGDVVLTERSLNRIQVVKVNDTRYDLVLTVLGADGARWKTFAEKNRRRQGALIVNGTVRTTFPLTIPDEEKEGSVITIENIAADETAADALKLQLGGEQAK